MPKDRKRKNMLIIACIMLFATLFTLVPAFSFSVTAARMNAGSVAEEYVRYQSRLRCIEKITELEENGFRLLEDQVFAMQLQKLPEDTPEDEVDEVWFYAALDKQYHRLVVLSQMIMDRFCTRRTSWRQITAIRENCGSP